MSITTRVVGDRANYLHARVLLTLGDVLTPGKKAEEAERELRRAQAMIGEVFSDNHPVICEYNSNLIEVYSGKQEEQERLQTVKIAEKNLDIARKFYGEGSLFTLKHELAVASNKIGAL